LLGHVTVHITVLPSRARGASAARLRAVELDGVVPRDLSEGQGIGLDHASLVTAGVAADPQTRRDERVLAVAAGIARDEGDGDLGCRAGDVKNDRESRVDQNAFVGSGLGDGTRLKTARLIEVIVTPSPRSNAFWRASRNFNPTSLGMPNASLAGDADGLGLADGVVSRLATVDGLALALVS
jgi:hypothetical protein